MRILSVDFSKLTKDSVTDMFIGGFEYGVMLANSLNQQHLDCKDNVSGYEGIVFRCLDGQRITASFFEGFFSVINYKKESVREYILSIDASEIGFVNEKELLSGAKKNFYKNMAGV